MSFERSEESEVSNAQKFRFFISLHFASFRMIDNSNINDKISTENTRKS